MTDYETPRERLAHWPKGWTAAKERKMIAQVERERLERAGSWVNKTAQEMSVAAHAFAEAKKEFELREEAWEDAKRQLQLIEHDAKRRTEPPHV